MNSSVLTWAGTFGINNNALDKIYETEHKGQREIENVSLFPQTKFFSIKSFTRKWVNCTIFFCNNTTNIANNTIFTSTTIFIPLWYLEVNPLRPFLPHFSQLFLLLPTQVYNKLHKIMTHSAFSTDSICSKPRNYPCSKKLHKQCSWRSWHFPCLGKTPFSGKWWWNFELNRSRFSS